MSHWRGLAYGFLGGAAGLIAMRIARRLTAPVVKDLPSRPMDVFLSERTISPLGPRHEAGESASSAIARMSYERATGERPSKTAARVLSAGVQIGAGLLAASLYGAIRGSTKLPRLRDGLWFGAGLWLVGDELVLPLLGLKDKPTAYHASRHAQSLLGHLGFGAATAGTARLLEG